jgi:hypothetical protein
MTGVYILLGGVVLIGGLVCAYDWLAERQHRRSH